MRDALAAWARVNLPIYDTLTLRQRQPWIGGRLLVASDGAVNPKSWGSAWVAQSGAWGLMAGRHPERMADGPARDEKVSWAELRALAAAVGANLGPLHLIVDAQGAARVAQAWINGVPRRRSWAVADYWIDGRPAAIEDDPPWLDDQIVELACALARRGPSEIVCEWVPAHSGHRLNYAADFVASHAAGMMRSQPVDIAAQREQNWEPLRRVIGRGVTNALDAAASLDLQAR